MGRMGSKSTKKKNPSMVIQFITSFDPVILPKEEMLAIESVLCKLLPFDVVSYQLIPFLVPHIIPCQFKGCHNIFSSVWLVPVCPSCQKFTRIYQSPYDFSLHEVKGYDKNKFEKWTDVTERAIALDIPFKKLQFQ